jgi:hypothetical protein
MRDPDPVTDAFLHELDACPDPRLNPRWSATCTRTRARSA